MEKEVIVLELVKESNGDFRISIKGQACAPTMCLLSNELFESGLKEIMNPKIPVSNLERTHLLSDSITLFKHTIDSAVSGELFKKGR